MKTLFIASIWRLYYKPISIVLWVYLSSFSRHCNTCWSSSRRRMLLVSIPSEK